MAEANAVIATLGQQVAQLTVDKAILQAEVTELRDQLEARAAIDAGECVSLPVEVAE